MQSVHFLNRILSQNEAAVGNNTKRLSQATKLLTDDPANYILYEKLEAQIRELAKVADNNAAMLSFYRYAESLLGNVIEVTQRIRELLISRDNPVFGKEAAMIIDSEINAQYDQILFVLKTGEFNGKKVFNVLFSDPLLADWFRREGYYSLANIDRLLSFIIGQRSSYGALMNRLEGQIKAEAIARENSQGFQSTIWDIDIASEAADFQKNQLLLLVNILLL